MPRICQCTKSMTAGYGSSATRCTTCSYIGVATEAEATSALAGTAAGTQDGQRQWSEAETTRVTTAAAGAANDSARFLLSERGDGQSVSRNATANRHTRGGLGRI